MNIEKVIELELGYLVDNSLVPNNPNNKDYKRVQEWINQGNTPDQEFTQIELLNQAKDSKILDIKIYCKGQLKRSTPQTISYSGNLSNHTFNIDVEKHLPLFESIISKLQRRIDAGEIDPVREWTDADGNRLSLTIEDFKSLANHLDSRDEQEFSQRSLKIDAVEAIYEDENKSLEQRLQEIKEFDVAEVIV